MPFPPRIGRYEIVAELASGGMAEILLARLVGPNGFERPVIIKRILPHLAREPSFVDMFLDEARIVAGIRHPNVVQVQELGHDEGELFLAMEYLDGETVAALMKRLVVVGERLAPLLAAHIVAQAGAGSSYGMAHFSGDGRRVAFVSGGQELIEVDLATRRVLRSSAYDGVAMAEYVGDELLVVALRWGGNLWMADVGQAR